MSNTDIFTQNAQAALARGFAIHPLKAGAKTPATRHGFQDATRDDQERLALWMTSAANANVGVATGEASGIWVLDVDKKGEGFETLVMLQEQHGKAQPTYTVLTPNGGAHYYYRWDPARPVKNKVRFANGLDTRGNGGYVVAAGSVVDGKTYDVVYDGPVVPAPAWLMDLVAPLEQPAEAQPEPTQPAAVKLATSATRISAWVERCINEEAAALAKVVSGGRNNALNKAAFRIGQVTHLVPGSEAQAEAALRSACEANGLIADKGVAAFEKSMASGFSGGRSKPRPGPADKPAGDRADWEASTEAAINLADLPVIRLDVNKQMRAIATEAMAALKAAGGMYVRGGRIVQIWKDEDGWVASQFAEKLRMRARLERVANFKRYNQRAGEYFPTYPPEDLANDLLNAGVDVWPFDALDGIIASPAMRPDGSVITEPGYDPATKLYYWPAPGFEMPPLLEHPTKQDAQEAAKVLDDLVCDFPFRDQASRDNALAFLLTLAARPAISGPVPLFVVNATDQGSGKSLLASVMALATSGVPLPVSTSPGDPDEFRKRILAAAIGGAPVVLIDNVVGSIENEHLAALVTAEEWKDRPLGLTAEVRVKVRSVWIVTGNSIRIGGDLIRRCVAIELDAQMSRPWDRPTDSFKYEDLKQFAREHRGDFPWAALTMLRAWHLAGRPKSPVNLGSFEGWAAVVGGALNFAGRTGLLSNAWQFTADADDSDGPWEMFMSALYGHLGTATFTPTEIYNAMAAPNSGLADSIPDELVGLYSDHTRPKFIQKLGYAFRARRGKRHGPSAIRVESIYDSDKKQKRWRFYTGSEKTQA